MYIYIYMYKTVLPIIKAVGPDCPLLSKQKQTGFGEVCLSHVGAPIRLLVSSEQTVTLQLPCNIGRAVHPTGAGVSLKKTG